LGLFDLRRKSGVRTVNIGALLAMIFAAAIVTASAQPGPASTNGPSLSETLQWLSGASEAESGDGDEHHTFENDGKDCSVIITETRTKASPGFWIKLSFSLADIDPDDIRVNDLSKPSTLGDSQIPGIPGKFAIGFHTTNYVKKIVATSNSMTAAVPTSDYIYFTNDWFAPKFAKAFAHAARLCGAKRSAF
jgi:hypothetical protein